jgi:iron(III) transport system permease protein
MMLEAAPSADLHRVPRGSTFWRLADQIGQHWLPLATAAPVLLLVPFLIVFTLYMTFVQGLPIEPGYTLRHWLEVTRPYVLFTVIPNTLIVACGSVLISLGFGVPLSWFINRTRMPLRSFAVVCIGLVIIVPGFVQAMAWQMLVNPTSGIFNKSLEYLTGRTVAITVNSLLGMAWVLGLALAPAVFFMLSGAMKSLNSELSEAAAVARISTIRTLMQIELPLLWPAILGAGLYTFMTAIAIFEVPAMLGGGGGKLGVLSTEVFYAVQPVTPVPQIDYGAAGVYGSLIMLPSFFAMYFYLRALGKFHGYAVVTGRGYSSRPTDLGRAKYVGIGFLWLYLLLALGLPLLVLIWGSLQLNFRPPSAEALSNLSLRNFSQFFPAIGGWRPLLNTIILMAGVSLVVMVISFMISWLVIRTKLSFRGVLDVTVFSSHAIPAIAIGFDLYLLALSLGRWVPLAGTLFIIGVAHAIASLAPATRITNAALLQIHPQLVEAAQICRARESISMSRVIMPLMKSSLLYGGLWTALLSAREVTMALFLAGTNNVVFSVGVWELWRTGSQGLAASAALLLVAIIGAVAAITMSLAKRLGGEAASVWL